MKLRLDLDWNLQKKIGALLVGCVLASALVNTWHGMRSTADALAGGTEERLMAAVSSEGARIEASLDGVRADLEFLSSVPSTAGVFRALDNYNVDPIDGSTATQWVQRGEAIVASLVGANAIYRRVRLINRDGRELMRVDRERGEIRIPEPGARSERSGETWFAATLALSDGEILVTPLALSRDSGEIEKPHRPVIRYAMPVFTEPNEPHGLFIIDVEASVFLSRLARDGESDVRALLVDAAGSYLFHSEEERRWASDLGHDARLASDYAELSEAVLSGERAVVIAQGEVLAYTPVLPLATKPDTYWVLVQTTPEAVAMAGVARFRNLSLLLLLVTLVLSAGAGVWVAGRVLVAPIRGTVSALGALATGDLGVRLPVSSNDEVGQMAAALNESMEKIGEALETDCVDWCKLGERQRQAARLSQMIENSPTSMMYVNRELEVEYVNPAAQQVLAKLGTHLPVAADEVVGQSIDRLHPDLEQQRHILSDPSLRPHEARIEFGAEAVDSLVSAIRDDAGESIGAMVTWELVTDRVRQEREVEAAAEREREQAELLRTKVDTMLGAVSVAAEGDLTCEVGISGDDAIGQMGEGLARFFTDLRSSLGSIGGNADALAAAAEQLTATSREMGSSAGETSNQAEQASGVSVQVNANVQTVATAAGELSSSIEEIASSAADAARVAAQAVEVVETTNASVAKLGESSVEVGNVIQVINSIAEQTNLLALNATIEAARAGEAGKGFAVVANEVKDLAKQTAQATEEIGGRIEQIQGDSESAVSAIEQIGEVIGRINEISGTIASAVEEQTATTSEISRNVQEAARGTADITENITHVAKAAEATSAGARDTQGAAGELAQLANQLNQLIGRYTT